MQPPHRFSAAGARARFARAQPATEPSCWSWHRGHDLSKQTDAREYPPMHIVVNGHTYDLAPDVRTSLLNRLRDHLRLTGKLF